MQQAASGCGRISVSAASAGGGGAGSALPVPSSYGWDAWPLVARMGLSVLLLGALLSPLMILSSCEGCERIPRTHYPSWDPSSGVGEAIRHVPSPSRTEAGVFFLNAGSCLHLSQSSPLLPFLALLLSSSSFCVRPSGHSVFWTQGGKVDWGSVGPPPPWRVSTGSTVSGCTAALLGPEL